MLLADLFTGSTIKRLTGKSFARDPVFIPSRVEREEIVGRVEALFALADTIKQCTAATLRRADCLSQSILSKALRGELASVTTMVEGTATELRQVCDNE